MRENINEEGASESDRDGEKGAPPPPPHPAVCTPPWILLLIAKIRIKKEVP